MVSSGWLCYSGRNINGECQIADDADADGMPAPRECVRSRMFINMNTPIAIALCMGLYR